MGRVILPLDCLVDYYEYNPKRDDTEVVCFYLELVKNSKRAILLKEMECWGELERENWMPKRFVKRVFNQNGCWYIEIDIERYCQFFNATKDARGLFTCGELRMLSSYVEGAKVSPIDREKPNRELESFLAEMVKG